MANGANDWALIVGITNYPSYGDTPTEANNLRAPINDATAVEQFLRNDLGVGNITLLTSSQNNGAAWGNPPRPIRSDVESWLRSLVVLSNANVAAGRGPQIGRRLYIYLSGHGLATERSRRALVTSDALSHVFIDHILVTAWQDSLSNSKFFSEYVLFFDCCSQAQVTLIPSLPPFQIVGALNPPAPQVVVCAAKYPLQAVELPLGANGQYHSVFTWELLRGLRGAAINPDTGGIRTGDLAAYLYKAVAAHIDRLPDRTGISREPDFLSSDDIEFFSPVTAPVASPPRTITITANGGPVPPDGTTVNVLDHARRQIGSAIITGGVINHSLAPGIYKLEWGQGHRLVEITDEVAIDA